MNAKYQDARSRITYKRREARVKEATAGRYHTLSKVVTLVEPSLEVPIAEATRAYCTIIHTRSIAEAIFATRDREVRALLISPNALVEERVNSLAMLVGRCSGVMTLAVVRGRRPIADQRLLDLGGCGVRQVVDLSAREGWGCLRELVSNASESTAQKILQPTLSSLGKASVESGRFMETMIRLAPTVNTVRELAHEMDVHESSLVSRFFRRSLPSPRRYLASTRLLYACAYLENASASLADVANRLGYSSPQSFGRHVKGMMGMTASNLRYRFSLERMIGHYIHTLIVPHRDALQAFDPIGRTHARVRIRGPEFPSSCISKVSGSAQSPQSV